MQNQKNNFEKTLSEIIDSNQSDSEKISALNNLIINLSITNQNTKICRVSEVGAVISRKANKPEMSAQFCLMRAKSEIAQGGEVIGEMKNINMALGWFEFALKSEEFQYKELDKKLQSIWTTTQTIINTGYKLLNEQPYVGAVAYCHRTAGQIYGAYYLQLKLHYFIVGKPWRARIGNYKLIKWLSLDDFFVINKNSRNHLKSVKNDCLKSIHQAVRLFKQEKAHEYIIDTYFDLGLEHHSFNNPVRSKFYLSLSYIFIKIYHLSDNHRLKKHLKSLWKLPLIGSGRDKNINLS
ncbi:MAG: hypothetical protein KAS02_02375 [Candidatus Pacebacteria bacterium]|nr:hypothetical protein [Candidatus Paceibacterota bacterium]